MATLRADDPTGSQTETELTRSLESATTHDVTGPTEAGTIPEKNTSTSPPMRIYTRPQILFLSRSPFIQLPTGMPELKDWFGSENEQNLSKKESDPTTPGTARERRFRRDAEDGETSSRPTFRSALSQPSQMGNFKHQSLRSSDREREKDRDRDTDKDRERDIRDKEGHERLRHLSDKYDRDRLALPLSTRTKDREAAPHLSAASSMRAAGQTQLPAGSRRGDTRDAIKKKAGEASEDWRKGPDLRSPRDERPESGRKDKDERAKSRGRDSSRSRRESSPSRREREKEFEREVDDDPRRWRDDGKRDERIATRRTAGHSERLREKDAIVDTDRRWVVAEDRESRVKRSGGRDRKPLADEGKDRDDRRDREREREKEPAWMDTYVPSSPSAGILGGKTGDGELDGIQAWKKERKEKELKGKIDAPSATGSAQALVQKPDVNGNPLDEIQLFRLLMKREEEKKRSDAPEDISQTSIADSDKMVTPRDLSPLPSNGASIHDTPSNGDVRAPSTRPSSQPQTEVVSVAALSSLSLVDGKDTAASVISQARSEAIKGTLHSANIIPPPESSSQSIETLRDVAPQFNPPPGSRLLAFARSAPKPSNATFNGATPNLAIHQQEFSQPIPSKTNINHSLPGFSPFDDQARLPLGQEEPRHLTVSPDANRRTAGAPHTITPPTEHPQFLDPSDNGNGFSANKGSRFAKFFDAKGREGSTVPPKAPSALASSPGPSDQRQGHVFNTHANEPDPRAMDEIYAMLSSSAQGSRGAPIHPHITPMPNSGGFALQQPPNHLHLLQQHQTQQQHLPTNRLEPLYESRLDDRNFVPDGMVPGLRSVPSPRNRDIAGLYTENMEEMSFNVQPRLPQQQQRSFEQLYSGGPPSLYGQQGGRGIPLQPNQYRGGPSPLSHQSSHVLSSQQRLPPGLANLGGRPPHEPSQILGMPGLQNPGLHNGVPLNGSNQQQPFNNFPPAGNLGYGGGPQIRGPHQLQSQGTHLPMGGHPNNLDMRTGGQNQLIGLGAAGGMRGVGGFFPPQQAPQLAMRQQLPPHMMAHTLPPHIQHHGPNSSQPTQDLMSLLMGGSHRE